MNEQIQTIANWLGSGSVNVFGIPFAGKDTQCQRLAEALNAEVIGGGDVIRHSQVQDDVKELVDSGDLAPVDAYLRLVLPYLSREEFSGKPLILSSVGRKQGEEQAVFQATAESSHPTKAVIYIHLEDEHVWERFRTSQELGDRGGREDDNEEALKTRLEKYREDTLPVIDFYREQGLVMEIDGSLSRDEVTDQIFRVLLERATNQDS